MKHRFLLACAIVLGALTSSSAQQSTTHSTTDAKTGIKVTTIATPISTPTSTPFTVASVKKEIEELDQQIAQLKQQPNSAGSDLLKKYEQKRNLKKQQLKELEKDSKLKSK